MTGAKSQVMTNAASPKGGRGAITTNILYYFVLTQKCIVIDICDGGNFCLSEGGREGGAQFFHFPPAGSANKRVGKVCPTFLPNSVSFEKQYRNTQQKGCRTCGGGGGEERCSHSVFPLPAYQPQPMKQCVTFRTGRSSPHHRLPASRTSITCLLRSQRSFLTHTPQRMLETMSTV